MLNARFTDSYETFVFTKAAAQYIFSGMIKRLEVWENCIFVQFVKGAKTFQRFVSKKRFLQHFADMRRARSRSLQVTPNAFDKNHFCCRGSQGDLYDLVAFEDGILCTCIDYQNQQNLIPGKNKLCKHGYAVLTFLGFSSLRDYLAAGGLPLVPAQSAA